MRSSLRDGVCYCLLVFLLHLPISLSANSGVETVRSLTISGNTLIPAARLKHLLTTRATSTWSWLPWIAPSILEAYRLRADLLRVRAFYVESGFLGAKIDTIVNRSDGVHVTFLIDEGEPTVIESVDVEGASLPARPAGQLMARPGGRLARDALAADRTRLLQTARDSGFAFATVSVQSQVDQERRRARVTYRVEQGRRCHFGPPLVEGNRGVSSATIRRGLTFRASEPFSARSLQESRRQLYLSGAFRSVVLDIPDSLSRAAETIVVVKVAERSARTVRIGAGYDTENRFQGQLAWSHRSAFGGGQQFTVSGQASANDAEGRLTLRQPYVFGSRNWVNFGSFVTRNERQNFSQVELGGNLRFERNIQARTALSIEVTTGLIDFQADSAFTEVVVGFRNDRRDDFLDPKQGVLVNLVVREKGLLLNSDREFLQLTGESRFYRPLPGGLVLATKVLGGVLVDLSDSGDIPNIERFFGGGLSSVRGWGFEQLAPRDTNENVVGGKSRLEGSVELRYRLGRYVGSALFFDVGNVGAELGAFDLAELGYAAGAGLRYLSPVGPIRFDVARRMSEDAAVGRYQFHISIGQAF